jgi:rSAM/selenodomain-associated transferase 2/rSAM/selenodomain-associated transferase 1
MERLLVFTRYPEPGKVKTRFIGALGAEGAAKLQHDLTKRTLAWVVELAKRRKVSPIICFEGGAASGMRAEFGADFPFRPQHQGDLGQRLSAALDDAFQAGAKRVVIVGCDCPTLDAEAAADAFDRLEKFDLVLGPALDGSYYLIGMKRPAPTLFEEIGWGGPLVLAQTMRAADSLGWKTSLLFPMIDLDRQGDLSVWRAAIGESRNDAERPDLSIVIPALNEEQQLAITLESTRPGATREVIVVDGGSSDGTVSVAAAHGAKVCTAPRGRARQMNWGAAVATGRTLLFLHADTRLPAHHDETIEETLAEEGVVAGAFRLKIADSRLSERLLAVGANLRSRWLAAPHGSQGLFLRSHVFRDLGGFADLPQLEDLDLVRRLRKLGKVALADASVVTSARSLRRCGAWRTAWRNQRVMLAALMGTPIETLAERFRR